MLAVIPNSDTLKLLAWMFWFSQESANTVWLWPWWLATIEPCDEKCVVDSV